MKKTLIATLLLMFAFSMVGTTGSALAFPGPFALPPPPLTSELVKNCLHKLVTLGTISHDQADKVSNYLKQNKFNPKNLDPQKLVGDLKNMGVTDKQAQAITDALRLPKPPGMSSDVEESVKNSLNKLVTSGMITQDQADKVSNYFKQNKFDPNNSDAQKLVGDLKNMGVTDKQAQTIADEIWSSCSSGLDTTMPAMAATQNGF